LTRAQPRARGSAVPMDLRLDASSTNLFSLHLEAARRNTWKSQPLRQGAAGSGATGCVLRRAAKPICDTDETDTSVRVQSLARKRSAIAHTTLGLRPRGIRRSLSLSSTTPRDRDPG